jgi:hypothetical protein
MFASLRARGSVDRATGSGPVGRGFKSLRARFLEIDKLVDRVDKLLSAIRLWRLPFGRSLYFVLTPANVSSEIICGVGAVLCPLVSTITFKRLSHVDLTPPRFCLTPKPPLPLATTVYTHLVFTSPSLLAALKSFPLLNKERDAR